MAERPLDELPLRVLFTNAERLSRELADHLDKGVMPKLTDFERQMRVSNDPGRRDEIPDATVRGQAARILSADEFTGSLCQQLGDYLQAIDKAVTKTMDRA